MDELYAINAAKTEFREALNHGDACRIIALADPDLITLSPTEHKAQKWHVSRFQSRSILP